MSTKHPKRSEGAKNGGLAELKIRLLFVLGAILIYRLGAHIQSQALIHKSSPIFSLNNKTQFLVCLICFQGERCHV